jgi:hypothetical protein
MLYGKKNFSIIEREILYKLVKQGKVADKYRPSLWLKASGAAAMISSFPGYYQELKR